METINDNKKRRVYIIVKEDSNGLREPVTCSLDHGKAERLLAQEQLIHHVHYDSNTRYRIAEVEYEL